MTEKIAVTKSLALAAKRSNFPDSLLRKKGGDFSFKVHLIIAQYNGAYIV